MKRLGYVAFLLVCAYAILIGATYNGILTSNIRLLSIFVLIAFAAFWLDSRRRAVRGEWQPSALDLPILLNIAAIVISTAANSEQWRRIAEGGWYLALYLALWYVLHDWLSRRVFPRRILLDDIVIAGVFAVFAGASQVWLWVSAGRFGVESLIRPVSIFGNPNTLAAFLVVLLPILIGRVVARTSPLLRILYAVYALLALVLLALTFSRGGWLGAGVGIVALVLLPLLIPDVRARLRARWNSWTGQRRVYTAFGLIAIVLAVGIPVAVITLNSLSIGGRGLDYRTFIWNTAVESFTDRPLAGYGTFTFGGQLALRNPTPFTEPHSHAHSLPLNIAAEQGGIGLVAFMIAVIIGTAAYVRLLRRVPAGERMTVIAAGAAVIGFGVHHLIDLPAMNPAIALTGLLALVAALAPVPNLKSGIDTNRVAQNATLRTQVWRWSPTLLTLLWAGVLVSGAASTALYTRYMDILSRATAGDYTAGAQALAGVVTSDPAMPIYHQQEGLLWALAGDAERSAVAFQQYTDLVPEYSFGWANLGAMRAANGQPDEAAIAMCHAAELAPDVAVYWWRCGEYRERAGRLEVAESAYNRALALQPDIALYPRWRGSEVRARVLASQTAPDREPSSRERVIYALSESGAASETDRINTRADVQLENVQARVQGVLRTIPPENNLPGAFDRVHLVWRLLSAVDEAEARFAQPDAPTPGSPDETEWFALVRSSFVDARDLLDNAPATSPLPWDVPNHRAWLAYGRYLLAQAECRDFVVEHSLAECDPAAAQTALAAARAEAAPQPLDDQFDLWENIAYIQYLRLTLPRQFVLQVEYPRVDGLLAMLLEAQPGS